MDELREAWVDWMVSLGPNVMIKLGGGTGASQLTMSAEMDRFFNKVQHHVRGRKWQQARTEDWPIFIAVFEHLSGARHAHVLGKAPDDITWALRTVGPGLWRSLRAGADYDCQLIEDPKRYAKYITKEFRLFATREDPFVYAKQRPTASDRKA